MNKLDKHYNKIIRWAKQRGFANIKANIDGYTTPSGFSKKRGEEVLIPDLTATKGYQKCYFEIAMKPTNEQRKTKLVSKWKLMSLVAQMKGGMLYLIAPRGNKSFAERILNRYDINAKLYYLKDTKLREVF